MDAHEVPRALRSAMPQPEGIHHLHSWSLADEQAMVTLHATINDDADPDQCIRDMARELEQQFRIRPATVQIEPIDCLAADPCKLRNDLPRPSDH